MSEATEATDTTHSEGAREGLVLTERIMGHVIGLLVLVQATLAGHSEWIAGNIDIEIHGVVGNATFTLILVAVVLGVVTQVGALRLGVLGALALLAVAQIGLGYMGRSSTAAAAWHVPLGVTIFGVAVYNIVLAREARLRARSAGS